MSSLQLPSQDRRPRPIDDETECQPDWEPALGMGDGEVGRALANGEARGNAAATDALGIRGTPEGPMMRRQVPGGARVLRLLPDTDEILCELAAMATELGVDLPPEILEPLTVALHSVEVWSRSPYWSIRHVGEQPSSCLWPATESVHLEVESAIEGETILSEGERDGLPTVTTEGDWVLDVRLTLSSACAPVTVLHSIPTAGRIVIEDLAVRR